MVYSSKYIFWQLGHISCSVMVCLFFIVPDFL